MVAVVAFFAVVIDAVIAYWFGTAEVVLYGFGNGHTLNCGSIFSPTDAPACAGTGSDDVAGFIVTMAILVIGIALIVIATVQERRGSWG